MYKVPVDVFCMFKSAAERMVGSGCIVQFPVVIFRSAHSSFDSLDPTKGLSTEQPSILANCSRHSLIF
jgi:hypothetical protein